MATTIHTYLHNDELDGSRIVSMDDCMCKLFNIRRDDSGFFDLIKADLQRPALYILLNKETKKAYIGETDDAMKRVLQHTSSKHFWTEAMVFLGTDIDTLTKTEVLYLEYLAYNQASSVKSYNLSENLQSPKLPTMGVMQRIKTEKFFKYVLFLSKFIGCEIFEHKKMIPSIVEPGNDTKCVEPVSIKYTSEDLAGRKYMSFHKKGRYCKRDIVFQIVKEYLKRYPDATFAELNATFKRDYLGQWSQYLFLNPDVEGARRWRENNDDHAHYFIKPDEILNSADGVQFCVCVEWDKNNIIKVLGIAAALGWEFEIVP